MAKVHLLLCVLLQTQVDARGGRPVLNSASEQVCCDVASRVTAISTAVRPGAKQHEALFLEDVHFVVGNLKTDQSGRIHGVWCEVAHRRRLSPSARCCARRTIVPRPHPQGPSLVIFAYGHMLTRRVRIGGASRDLL